MIFHKNTSREKIAPPIASPLFKAYHIEIDKTLLLHMDKKWDFLMLKRSDYHMSESIMYHHSITSWMGLVRSLWALFALLGSMVFLVFATGAAAMWYCLGRKRVFIKSER